MLTQGKARRHERGISGDADYQRGPLHRLDGALATRGWATYQALSYDRSRIKAPRWRIKEWDYYLVNDGSYAVALTLSDLGYAGLVSASLIDFDQAAYKTTSVVTPFPMGRFRLPASSKSGVSAFENDRVSFRFEAADGVRTLSAQFAKFDGDDDLSFDAMLSDEPRDSMVISTPWADATDGRKIADRFDMLKPWQVADDEGRLDLEFTPLLDRKDYRDLAFIRTDQHQVFGSFDGTVVLDDGTPFKVTGLQGSAEIVHNVY